MRFNTPFGDHNVDTVSFPTTGRTKQTFKDECDINNIMKSYARNGLLEHVNNHRGNYGDFINTRDYHSAMNEIGRASEMFATLPSLVRKRFGNDVASFLDFVHDSSNLDEMRKLGLLKEKVDGSDVSKESVKTDL